MAINRIKSPYAITQPTTNIGAQLSPSSYAFCNNYRFISTGQIGTTAGFKYQVHTIFGGPSALTGNLVFSRGGFIDILLLGPGGNGQIAYYSSVDGAQRSRATGGGGGGGLLIYYNQQVSANVNYAYQVGNSQTNISGDGPSQTVNTTFLGYTAIQGGGGGGYLLSVPPTSGGSGGGGAWHDQAGSQTGGAGTTGQGNSGGNGVSTPHLQGGGGGGYSSPGTTGTPGTGGSGIGVNFDGTYRAMAAGGGGGAIWSVKYENGGLVDGAMTGGSGGTGNSAWVSDFNGMNPISFGCGGGGAGTSGNGGYGSRCGNTSAGLLMIRYAI